MKKKVHVYIAYTARTPTNIVARLLITSAAFYVLIIYRSMSIKAVYENETVRYIIFYVILYGITSYIYI